MPLTRQQRMQLAAQQRVQPGSIPCPIGGWNTRDSIAEMPASDAVQLDNWFPDTGGLTLRGGTALYASGIGTGAVPSLAEFFAGGTRKFLAAGGGAWYDISGGGAVGSPLASGFLSDWWQTIAFNNHMFFLNGQDPPQIFDGTTMSAASFTIAEGSPSISLSSLIGGITYQNRLYFIDPSLAGFWYGPLLGISGALAYFDLSMLSELGGNLAAITSFSYDGGSGVFDFIAFIMSSGETFIFQGTDPSLSTTWELVGRYRLAPPVNIRSTERYGGDSYVTTAEDHVTLQQGLVALRAGLLPPRSKVCGAVLAAIQANPSANGWQTFYWQNGRRILFNIPNPDGTFDQHVLSIANGAWCRYGGFGSKIPAATWGSFKGNLFFGQSSGGNVYQAEIGNEDFGVQAIQAIGQQAWNALGSATRKRITAFRPIVESVGVLSYSFGIGYDFGDINVPVNPSVSPSGSPWDTSPWDISPWSPESQISPDWHTGGGSGLATGWSLSVATSSPTMWLRTDAFFEQGRGV